MYSNQLRLPTTKSSYFQPSILGLQLAQNSDTYEAGVTDSREIHSDVAVLVAVCGPGDIGERTEMTASVWEPAKLAHM